MTESSDGQITVSGLTKVYRKVRAVDDLSFTVAPGRVTGFLGPNGAGKTTTLRMLLNLVKPTSGTATIGGRRYADIEDPIRTVGAILEASGAHRGRRGRAHLKMLCYAAGIPASRADDVLNLVGLTPAAKRKFKGYSLGMRQRLGIGAALLGDPQVLILDEPANGLDPEGIRWMRDLLKGLADEGRTVLVSSHLLSEMEILADDLVIIAAGKLVRQGTVGDIIDSMGTAQLRVRTSKPDELIAALDPATVVVRNEDGSMLVSGIDAKTLGDRALDARVPIYELVADRPDLENVFLQLTAGKAAIR
jgi:ABC-2 type transport system ATP-binding protein